MAKVLLPGLKLLGAMGIFIGSFLFLIFLGSILPKFGLRKSLSEAVSGCLCIVVLLGWLVVFPLCMLVYKDGLEFSAAMWKYGESVGCVLLAALAGCAIFGAILLVHHYLSKNSPDSLLKRALSILKANACPILHEKFEEKIHKEVEDGFSH